MSSSKSNVKTVPWADRHRPKHLGEVIGNTDAVRKLAAWLRDWDDVVFHGKVKEEEKKEDWMKYAKAPELVNARAALVSGPPGIGKTTTATLVARLNPKYTLMEFNASDARSKKIVEQLSNSLSGNHTLKMGNAKGGSCLQRTVIIMDECDGMSSGDVGGMAALMNMIKVTKNPIICICNERGDQHVRKLSEVCYDIKFKRPDNVAVAKRIKHVMEGEGKKVDLHAIEAVVEACGHDIRHIINQTQFFGSVSAHGGESQKDAQVMLNPFDACQKLLQSNGKKKAMLSMGARLDMFYLDADMMPLMVHENYLSAFEKRRGDSQDDMNTAAKAAEMIALGDSMAGNWEVMGSAAVLGTIYPAFLAADPSFERPKFPAWLMKRGAMTKAARTVSEMHGKLRGSTAISIKDLATTSYHDVLYRRLIKPLQYGAAKEAAALLFATGLGREFFTEQAMTLRKPLLLDDLYQKVEGKHKSQLMHELMALAAAAKPPDPVKRKRDDGPGSSFKRKSRGPWDKGNTQDNVEVEDGEAAEAAKKKKKNTKETSESSRAAASLGSWRKVDEAAVAAKKEADANKEPLLIVRYLDGHTNAVRRTLHIQDIMEPWILF